LLDHPLVVELAKKYNKSQAQILLRHLVHLKIGVIPKSLTPERVRENFDIFNFKLTDAEIQRFDDEINEDVKFFLYTHLENNPFFREFFLDHLLIQIYSDSSSIRTIPRFKIVDQQ
jgi:diketogulonate reductase-like aldo/keto reductase